MQTVDHSEHRRSVPSEWRTGRGEGWVSASIPPRGIEVAKTPLDTQARRAERVRGRAASTSASYPRERGTGKTCRKGDGTRVVRAIAGVAMCSLAATGSLSERATIDGRARVPHGAGAGCCVSVALAKTCLVSLPNRADGAPSTGRYRFGKKLSSLELAR